MKIAIPQPCDKLWNQMIPHASGKLCQHCSKVLTDFTRFTNQELQNYLSSNRETEICGRFRKNQLDREIASEAATITYSGLSLQALVLIAVALTQNPLQAQIPDTISLEQTVPDLPDKQPNSSSLLIKGYLRDSINNESIPFMLVQLMNNGQIVSKTQTNLDGYFQFQIAVTTVFDSLQAGAIDHYKLITIPLTINDTKSDLEIQLMPVMDKNDLIIGIIQVDKKTIRKNKRRNRRSHSNN